jgi:hypothetical protein
MILLGLLAACAPAAPAGPEPEMVNHTYPISEESILNPERGFFTPYELPGPVGFSAVRATGNTLVHVNIRLDDWRESDLPQAVLDGLNVNFADMRDAGVKAIIRFAYNQGPWPDSEPDASKAQILRHIEQLTPILKQNGDVIAWAEAGFIGAWGEWHTSTNGLDNLTDKRDILNAFLAAMPPDRVVQVRYPANIIEMYPEPAAAAAARVGHHNDCFLSSDTDVGTYERDGVNTIVRDQAYLAELTRNTPMSGETCAPNPPRSECAMALQEMALLHFSAINEAYHKGILRSWEDGGCLEEIQNRMGYRLALKTAAFNEQAQPGGRLNLTVTLENNGFAAPVNPRLVFVVLVPEGGDGQALPLQLDLDPRQWQPGETTLTAEIQLPGSLPQGDYGLALWLPDPAEPLRANPLYAIRLANEGVWGETTGYNRLGTVSIRPDAGGSQDKRAELSVLALTITTPPVGPVPLPADLTAVPTDEPAAAPAGASIDDLQVSADEETISIQFRFTGDPAGYNGYQVFIDTDLNAESGYTNDGAGAEYLLENESLFTYGGSGSDWAWTQLEPAGVDYQNEAGSARWTVPKANLDNPPAFRLMAQLVDTGWNTVFVSKSIQYPQE